MATELPTAQGLGRPLNRTMRACAETCVEGLLKAIGLPVGASGLKDTPARVVRAFEEMTAGYAQDPAAILGTVFAEEFDEVVILRGVAFTSLCEHHLLPFVGTVDLGYLPGGKGVVGLSKLARLVECFARRFQVQERMTREIAGAVQEHLGAKGVGVVVRAGHSCMACRGVRKAGAEMITSVMLGAFRDKPEARAEFLALCSSGRG